MGLVVSFTKEVLARNAQKTSRSSDYFDDLTLDCLPLRNADISGLTDYFWRLDKAGVATLRHLTMFEREHFFRLFPPESEEQREKFLWFMREAVISFVGEPEPELPKLFIEQPQAPDTRLD